MMNFLSKTESKRKPKLDDSFEVKGSLRSLIHSQTNPKFKEVIKNSEIKLPLSRPSFFKKTQSNQNVSQSKRESKATEIQTLFKLNQNISKKGIDITDTFIKKLKNRINSIISLLSSDYYEYNSIIELADEWLQIFFENQKKLQTPKLNEGLSLENKQLLKNGLSLLSLSIAIVFDYYTFTNYCFLKNITIEKDSNEDINKILDAHIKLGEVCYTYIKNQNNNQLRICCNTILDLEKKIVNDFYSHNSITKYQDFSSILQNIRTISVTQISKFYIVIIKNGKVKEEEIPTDEDDKETTTTTTKENTQLTPFKQPVPYMYSNTFLIPFPCTKDYTLVLDLDETLVNVNIQDCYISLRPGLKIFLNQVFPYYEIILFTTSIQSYADEVLKLIERDQKYFTYRLYRQHAKILGDKYTKDLSNIGRDLARTVIVDDRTSSFALQKENGILIRTFIDDKKKRTPDFALYELGKILVKIAEEKTEDIRESLKKYKDEIDLKVSI